MPSTEPMIPPTSNDASTIRVGALEPTAADQSRSLTALADDAAMSRVTSPRPSVTTSRVRWASRWPTSTPRVEPISTVQMLTSVPTPGNTGPPPPRDGWATDPPVLGVISHPGPIPEVWGPVPAVAGVG